MRLTFIFKLSSFNPSLLVIITKVLCMKGFQFEYVCHQLYKAKNMKKYFII